MLTTYFTNQTKGSHVILIDLTAGTLRG